MKKCVIINIISVIILVLVLCWYLFGEYGPFGGELVLETAEDEGIAEENVAEDVIEEKEPEEVVINDTTTIVFTGDVEISEYIQANYSKDGVNGVVDQEVLDLLSGATYTMINNEFCFSTRGTQAKDKQFTFRVDPSYVNLLTDMGVDIAGLANNHVLDFGQEALLDTFDTLESAGIEYTGAGNSLEEASKLVVKTDDMGRTYGFLASSHVIPVYDWDIQSSQPGEFTFYNEDKLLERISQASKEVDYLFVMVHWGVERTTQLESYQVNDGHKFIDAGATAVIGMHSHCLQPVEIYNGHPIFYSLGNFIFNSNISSGGAVRFTFDGDSNMTTEIIPIVAEGAKTRKAVPGDSDYYNYVESISSNVSIDELGIITLK